MSAAGSLRYLLLFSSDGHGRLAVKPSNPLIFNDKRALAVVLPSALAAGYFASPDPRNYLQSAC